MRGIGTKTGIAVEIGEENHVARIIDATVVNPDLQPCQTWNTATKGLEGIAHRLDRCGALFRCFSGHVPHDDMTNGAGGGNGIGHARTPEMGGVSGTGPLVQRSRILPAKRNVINHVNQKTFLQISQERKPMRHPLDKMHL